MQGIILPHHELAKEILNQSFQKLKENSNPKTIVIYGANHYFPISETYTSTRQIRNDFKLVNLLANDARVEKDHSIQTLLPYIKEYFPEAKVIPILVSTRYQSLEGLNSEVKNFLKAFGGEKTLYIASVDFAHNLSLEEGLSKNKESIENITNFDYENILKYQDDHIDSPLAITSLLLTMENLGATSWETWYTTHGALVTGNLDLNSTSYVIGSFTKK